MNYKNLNREELLDAFAELTALILIRYPDSEIEILDRLDEAAQAASLWEQSLPDNVVRMVH